MRERHYDNTYNDFTHSDNTFYTNMGDITYNYFTYIDSTCYSVSAIGIFPQKYFANGHDS